MWCSPYLLCFKLRHIPVFFFWKITNENKINLTHLLKCSRILSSRTVSGKFPTQRCRVSRTIVPQVLHGGDFSGLGAVNPILDKFSILFLSHSLSRSRALSFFPPPSALLLRHTSTLGIHLPGTDRDRNNFSLNTIFFPFSLILNSRTHLQDAPRRKGRSTLDWPTDWSKVSLTRFRTTATRLWTATYGDVCDCYIIFRTTNIARISVG